MLGGIDRGLELAGWTLALFLVIMLFVGPQVIAEDKPAEEGGEAAGAAPYADQADTSGDQTGGGDDGGGGEAAADGEALFTDNCGSCHTLSAAGTSGSVGPNLDDTSLDAAAIESIVRDGSGSMPAFGGDLSDAEITAVAEFVAGN
jgi:mono/diheme cytochrome c family protein